MNHPFSGQGKVIPIQNLFLTILPVSLTVCFLAITDQSFWIDECGVAFKAALPTLGEFWHKISTEGSADLQQPFHHFFAWGWEKLMGLDEFTLRAGNIPFLLGGITVAVCAFAEKFNLLRGMMVVLLTSPFVWFYLNEARPYAVQIGASLTVFSALFRLAEGPDTFKHELRWVLVLCSGIVLLATSGMLAMLWLGAYLAGAIATTPTPRMARFLKTYRLAWAGTLLLLFAMGLFYLWTLSIGARATAVGTTDFRNLAFIPYELLGFIGLGPGRLEIRSEGLAAFKPWAPVIMLHAVTVLAMLGQGWVGISELTTRRQRIIWPFLFLLVAGFILLVGVVTHFRVLGRHCTPTLPLLLVLLGAGVARAWRTSGVFHKALLLAFIGLTLISSFSVRLARRHGKDDYRAAAAFARTQLSTGAVVWWNADAEGAAIYALPTTTNPLPDIAVWVANPVAGFETNLPYPKYVLASKPDVYDGTGALARYLERNKFVKTAAFNAFTIWQAPASE